MNPGDSASGVASLAARKLEVGLVNALPPGWGASVRRKAGVGDYSSLEIRAIPPGAVAERHVMVGLHVDAAQRPGVAKDIAVALVDHYDAQFSLARLLAFCPALGGLVGALAVHCIIYGQAKDSFVLAAGGGCGCPACAG